jgi:hypothetical protein
VIDVVNYATLTSSHPDVVTIDGTQLLLKSNLAGEVTITAEVPGRATAHSHTDLDYVLLQYSTRGCIRLVSKSVLNFNPVSG